MRKTFVAAIATLGLIGSMPAAGLATPTQISGSAHAAKTCSSAYTRGTIGGKAKCLHAGEFCAKRYAKQYPKYGFHCRQHGGSYRLS